MTDPKRKIERTSERFFEFLKATSKIWTLLFKLLMPIVFLIWLIWEWEPLRGRSFHRLVVQQDHQLRDVVVSVLHEIEIRVDTPSQMVIARILRPNVMPPLAVFRDVGYGSLSTEEQQDMDLFNMLPDTAVYRFEDCQVFSSDNWSCTVPEDLRLLTYDGGIEMRDGKWIGVRGEVIIFKVAAFMRRMQCEENICNIQSDLDLEDAIREYRLD